MLYMCMYLPPCVQLYAWLCIGSIMVHCIMVQIYTISIMHYRMCLDKGQLHLQEKEALLPPEPTDNAEQPTVSCLFRMPDGTRASRRFLQSQPAQSLFDYADAKGAGGLPFGGYQLVMQFPRRVVDFALVQSKSILEAGLSSPQEVLLLERIATNQTMMH